MFVGVFRVWCNGVLVGFNMVLNCVNFVGVFWVLNDGMFLVDLNG
jgi:hypothetical protein